MRQFAASFGLLLILICQPAFAQMVAGKVTHLSGVLTAKRADGQVRVLAVRSEVHEGDTLTTEQDAYARIKFIDDAEIVLRPQSQIVVSAYRYAENKASADNVVLNMIRGGLRAVTGLIGKRNRENVKFGTPTATIGIRGTHFGILFCQSDCVAFRNGPPPPDGLHIDVASGAIFVSNNAGQLLIGTGQFGFVPSDNLPPQIVPVENAVKIILPSSISRNDAGGRSVSTNKDAECIAGQ